jgi:hypothetical protein
MRTITTIELGERSDGSLEDFLSHLYVTQLRPNGDTLRSLFAALPKHVKKAQGGDVPGPDHQEIESVLHELKVEDRTGDWYRSADALSLICQATSGELALDSIVGCVTVLVGHTPINGVVTHVSVNGRHRVVVRLRGTPDTLYPATESLVRSVFRVEPVLEARHVTCVSKERGSDAIFETLDVSLIRHGGLSSILSAARTEGLVDGLPGVLFAFAVVGFVSSWFVHFQPGWLGMGVWRREDLLWLDGWIGRLTTSAIFGLVSLVGTVAWAIRKVFAEEDGIYLKLSWRR